MAIRAVVTDLDGTLWWGQAEVHPTIPPALETLRAADVPLVVATGRRYNSARRGLEPLGLLGPTVLLSGSIGVHMRTDRAEEREWHRAAMSSAAATQVYEALDAVGLRPVIHVGQPDLDAVIPTDVTTHPDHVAQFGGATSTDVSQALGSDRVVGFGICGLDHDRLADMEAAQAALSDIAQLYVGPDHVMGGYTLLGGPPGVSKVSALSGWAAEMGLDPREVLAVGDGSNDVEMLAWAGTAVAVEGGATTSGRHDHVIAQPQQGGWATVLDLLGI